MSDTTVRPTKFPSGSRRSEPPPGFRYQPELLSPEQERELVVRFRELPLKEFEFQGHLARRRVFYYGWQYGYGDRALHEADPIPEFLISVRERAAAFAEMPAERLVHAMVSEYRAGTPIGWHR